MGRSVSMNFLCVCIDDNISLIQVTIDNPTYCNNEDDDDTRAGYDDDNNFDNTMMLFIRNR